MIKKLKNSVPLICLICGWAIGILLFYILNCFHVELPAYKHDTLTFKDVCTAIFSQIKLFILVTLLGFSMLSGILPPALVLIKSAYASFSCALVYNCAVCADSRGIRYFAFALTSALICVFLTSSARLSHIFYTKVPHDKPTNILDYIARQLFTVGFAIFAMIFYYTVSAVT